MIAYLRGNFAYKSPTLVHVEVGGVGYELQISLNTYSRIQDQDKGLLLTYFHVREDAQILYGFFDQGDVRGRSGRCRPDSAIADADASLRDLAR